MNCLRLVNSWHSDQDGIARSGVVSFISDLIAELKPNDVVKANYKFKSVGQYSQSYVFRLAVIGFRQIQLNRFGNQ